MSQAFFYEITDYTDRFVHLINKYFSKNLFFSDI